MKKSNYHVLGVMSGTSLDGIDLAHVQLEVSEDYKWTYNILKAQTIPYSETWRLRLKEAVHFSEGRLKTLNTDYTAYLANVISSFIKDQGVNNLDAVCSHGHTILHQPENGITLQIGNLPDMAALLNEKVVCDFRVEDVALGGQGAPLVPIGDRLLFSEYDYCLNLGGFANISTEYDGNRLAYDICPVNIVMNSYAEILGHPFDNNGEIARSGISDIVLLEKLNALSFYKSDAPKSLGLEWVQKQILPILKQSDLPPKDILRTFVEHIAIQITNQLTNQRSILITGGGAYNEFLLERIRSMKDVQLVIPDASLLEFKEALVFGLLGVLKMRDEVNCLASVTGAIKDHMGGTIFTP